MSKPDNFLFTLDSAERWGLGADHNQWILMKAKKNGYESYWQAISFIGPSKTVLYRVLADYGVLLTIKARTQLASMPERFLDWRDGLEARAA